MKEQVAVQNLLRTRLTDIQKSNPQYSLRAFAKKVDIHAGALSSILNGKRNVSRQLAERIAEKLFLDPQERSELLGLFPEKRRPLAAGLESGVLHARYLEFNASQFKIVAEWEHFAVMSLLNCANFESDPKWIADRLGITESRAKQVLERLVQLELFRLDETGNYIRQPRSYRTSDDIANVSLNKCHEQTLELAKLSLYRDSVKQRDFTSITMAIDPSKIPEAKERIRKLQDELSDILESGDRTEVYRMAVQLFPMTKVTDGEQT
jgi:uncharacterized protein (TIGR02147 family)